MIEAAVFGYGNIGSGVVRVIEENQDRIEKAVGEGIHVKYVLDLRDFEGDPIQSRVVHDVDIIVDDPDIRVIAETMGGNEPAYTFTKKALEKGKSVCTSNKELVANHGAELIRIAKAHGCSYLFEASVGGGVPIIRPITQCLAANEIDEIAGVLNGTTNFILTKMIEESMSFDDALKLAQENGYAEKDPTADIEGFDSCRKICILASLCFGKHVYPDQIHTEGITKVTLEDAEYVGSYNAVIKLLGRAKRISDDKICAMVSPCIVKNFSQLGNVHDVFNAILVRGDAIGDVVFYGKGAGKLPTASAVVADVIDCAKHAKRKKIFGWEDSEPDYIYDYRKMENALYVRAESDDRAQALEKVAEQFGEITVLYRRNAPHNEFAFVTDVAPEGELMEKLNSIESITPLSVIRVTDY